MRKRGREIGEFAAKTSATPPPLLQLLLLKLQQAATTLCLSKSGSGERGSARCDLEKMRKMEIWGKLSEQQQMS